MPKMRQPIVLDTDSPWHVHADITDTEVNGWGETGDNYWLFRCSRCAHRYVYHRFYDVFFKRGQFSIICSPCMVQVAGNLAEEWASKDG